MSQPIPQTPPDNEAESEPGEEERPRRDDASVEDALEDWPVDS